MAMGQQAAGSEIAPCFCLLLLPSLQFNISKKENIFCCDFELRSNVRYPLQIVNVTELQLPQVDVRVGLDGAVDFLDKSPQALRQLKDLASQVGYRDPGHSYLEP
jgi:hypothetical protein